MHRAFLSCLRHRDTNDSSLHVHIEKPHADFVTPVDERAIREAIARVPDQFAKDLWGVFLLSGSRKQARVAESLFCYGTYMRNHIFLAPFPRTLIKTTHRRPPPLAVLREWVRAGAEIRETKGGLSVELGESALRTYYLREVLMHEIGHHVDRRPRERARTREGFANWFALEYGYRLRRDRPLGVEPLVRS